MVQPIGDQIRFLGALGGGGKSGKAPPTDPSVDEELEDRVDEPRRLPEVSVAAGLFLPGIDIEKV